MNELEKHWKTGDAIRRSLMYKIMEEIVNIYVDQPKDTGAKITELFRLQKRMEKLGLFDEEAEYELHEWVRDLVNILDSERGK